VPELLRRTGSITKSMAGFNMINYLRKRSLTGGGRAALLAWWRQQTPTLSPLAVDQAALFVGPSPGEPFLLWQCYGSVCRLAPARCSNHGSVFCLGDGAVRRGQTGRVSPDGRRRSVDRTIRMHSSARLSPAADTI
jgi:hypothetical protein